MLKKILELAGFPGLMSQARDIVQTVEKQPATQAAASLLSWLPGAVDRCNSHVQKLELLNTVSPSALEIMGSFHRDLMTGEGNLVKTNLLLQNAAPLAAWMRDQYFMHLHHALPILQKSGPLPLWGTAVSNYLDWNSNAFILAFFTPPAPQGFDWQKMYPIYEPTKNMLNRQSGKLLSNKGDIHRVQLQKSLSRILLLVRSLSSDLSGRQTLIAARIVEMLHPFLRMSDTHSTQTPYGTDIHDVNPPTLLDGDKPPQADHRLFFGLENALIEIVAIENLLLSQTKMPPKIMVSDSQTTAETLSVLKHLRNRWSGRQMVRKANRTPAHTFVEVDYSLPTIRRHLAGEASQTLGQQSSTRMRADVEDMSATGYGLQVNQPAAWATVGSLVAIFPPQSQHWVIGTIRRILPRPNHKIMVGVQLLALQPQSLRLYETAKVSDWEMVTHQNTYSNYLTIYLPPSPLNSGQASLLTEDRVLAAGRVYRTQFEGETMWLKVQAVLELGADYVQYSCTKVDKPMDETPSN